MSSKNLQVGTSVSERVFYLSCSFDGEFTRGQAIEVLEKHGYPKKSECFQNLSNSGMTEKSSLNQGKKVPALYRVTEKGHLTATQFEKMIERANGFIQQQEDKNNV